MIWRTFQEAGSAESAITVLLNLEKLLEGSTIGTITDLDGSFVLSYDPNEHKENVRIGVSYVGYKYEVIPVMDVINQKDLVIVLKVDWENAVE